MALSQTMKDTSGFLILGLVVMAHFQNIESVCTIDCAGSGGTIVGSFCKFTVEEEFPEGTPIVSLAFSAEPCSNPTLIGGSDAAAYLEMNGNNIVMKKVLDYEADPSNFPSPIFVEVECQSETCTNSRLIIEFTNINDNPIQISASGSTAEVWELITYSAGDPLDVIPEIHATDADVESFLLYTIKETQSEMPFRLVNSQGNTACFPSYDWDGSVNTESPVLEVSGSHVFDYKQQPSYELTVMVQSFMIDNGCREGAVDTVEYPLLVSVKTVDAPRCECVCSHCSAAPDSQSWYRREEANP